MVAERPLQVICACILLATTARSGLIPKLGEADLIVQFVEQCKENPDTSLTLKNLTLSLAGKNEFVVDAVVTINSKVTNDYTLDITLSRCNSKQQDDSCKRYLFTTLKNICARLPEKDQMWSAAVEHMPGLPKRCPIEAGTYMMKDAPIDLSEFKNFPIVYGYWKAKAVGKEGGAIVNCNVLEFDLKKKKKKKSFS